MRTSYCDAVNEITCRAGITINGSAPYDIRVSDQRFYARVLSAGSLGLGESYMEGWWHCEQLHELMRRLLRSRIHSPSHFNLREIFAGINAKIMNLQSPRRAAEVARIHYNLPTEVFECMLDSRMVYSCAYWKGVETLEAAQEQKLHLICQKLGLSARDRLLDIGCGWGSLVRFACERYGCEAVGITISDTQAAYAQVHCAGLPIKIYTGDYRTIRQSIHGLFTKVASIGMFEHVGPKNYSTFMEIAKSVLADDGLLLLQTIGDNRSETHCDPWLNKYIFPNGVAPSVQQIGNSTEGKFVLEDWHNFGPDYARTLLSWYSNLISKYNPRMPVGQLSPSQFLRMLEYYLNSFASAFAERHLQLWQLVFSTGKRLSTYDRVRIM